MCLISPFNEEEIRNAIFSFEGNKAPGPDGFTIEFLKKFWNIFKNDVMKVFQDFFQNTRINKITNETYIVLIAKKEKSITTADYIPISLTTSLYKIIAKILSPRLRKVLQTTISENQLAFVKERQITDAILTANEAIDLWRKQKTKCCL